MMYEVGCQFGKECKAKSCTKRERQVVDEAWMQRNKHYFEYCGCHRSRNYQRRRQAMWTVFREVPEVPQPEVVNA